MRHNGLRFTIEGTTIEAVKGAGPTVGELLDELEARVAALRRRARMEPARVAIAVSQPPAGGRVNWEIPVAQHDPAAAHELRVQMGLAGLSEETFATVFRAPVEQVRGWTSGKDAVPAWVLPALRVFELLTPALQKQALKKRLPPARVGRKNAHPFSRIEEL